MRAKAREVVFQVVFASRFSDGIDYNLKKALARNEKLTENDIAYADRILSVIDEHKEEFGKLVDERSYAFPGSGIFPADLSILFVALAEILYTDDIPDAVSVNEAANIASKYSSGKSASFISGILSEVIRDKNNV